MSLGSYNNNKGKEVQSPQVYSQYKFFNNESFDPSGINFTFWNGMLKVAVAPPKGENTYDWDNAISVYLTHIKSKQLLDEIKVFLENPKAYKNMGVTSGSGLISISNGIEFTGKNDICLTLRKLNEENGSVESSICYVFREDHYAIRNFDEKKADYDKVFNEQLEIQLFMTILEQHYQAMSGAVYASIAHYDRYAAARRDSRIDAMAEKLGVEFKSGGNGGGSKKGSFFDNSGSSKPASSGKPSRSYSLDDLEDE